MIQDAANSATKMLDIPNFIIKRFSIYADTRH